MSRDRSGLERIVEEAREHFQPPSPSAEDGWAELERRLREVPSRAPRDARAPWAAIGSGLALAAAALVVVLVRPLSDPPLPAPSPELAATVSEAAGLVVASESGAPRDASSPVRVGDRLTTTHAAVELVSRSESGAPAVTWRIERDSSLAVRGARAPLQLVLDRGAVEADVAAVASGEAFVVDVGTVRVAVRGTHLRVAREGDRVSVDLTEGAIVVGPIPASPGLLTEGTPIAAPARVELDLARPHEVRVERAGKTGETASAVASHPEVRREPPLPSTLESPPSSTPSHPSSPSLPPSPETVTAAPPSADAGIQPDARTPTEVVRDAVRACVDRHVSSGAIHVTVSTTLVLDVEVGGRVKAARFEPPLLPEVQSCASETIYEARFGAPGIHRITVVAER